MDEKSSSHGMELDLNVSQYHQLNAKMRSKKAFRLSSKFGFLTVLFETGMMFFSVYLCTKSQPWGFLYWIGQILLGISLYRCSVLLHECGHHSLFKGKFLNDFFGFVSSAFCFFPYTPWREQHNLHHRWSGIIDKDPTMTPTLDIEKFSKFEVVLLGTLWKLFIPISFVIVNLKVYWTYPFQLLQQKKYKRAAIGFFSLFISLVLHAIVIFKFGFVFYLVTFGPATYVSLVIGEAFMLIPHYGHFPYNSHTRSKPLPYWEQIQYTRSVALPKWLAFFLSYNFSYHIEHHLFPGIPWYSLPKVYQSLREMEPERYNELDFFQYASKLRKMSFVKYIKLHLPKNV